MISAFTLLFTLFSISAPMHDSSSALIVRPMTIDTVCVTVPNVTCSECIHTVDFLKNETAFLAKIAGDVEYICGRIYGPAAHECVNVTDELRKGLDYLSNHNSTEVCKHLHYC